MSPQGLEIILWAIWFELFCRYWNPHQVEDILFIACYLKAWRISDQLESEGWWCRLPLTSPPTNQKNVHELITIPESHSLILSLKTFPWKLAASLCLLNTNCLDSLLDALWSTLHFPSSQPGSGRVALLYMSERTQAGFYPPAVPFSDLNTAGHSHLHSVPEAANCLTCFIS